MSNEIFLSIIIPMYNSEKYILNCLNSINDNQFKDYEIILIDDKSKDKSYNLSKEFLENNFTKYKIIRNEKNLGQSYCRNKGIENAGGEYLLFLDSDDFIESKLIQKAYDEIKIYKDKIDILIYDFKRVSFNGDKRENKNLLTTNLNGFENGIDIFYKYKNNKFRLWTSSLIYRKNFILENNIKFLENCHAAEDLNFIFKSLVKSNKLKVINDTLAYYCSRRDSLTNSPNLKKNITVIDSMEDFVDFINNDAILDIKIKEDIQRIIKYEFLPEHLMYTIFSYLNKETIYETLKILRLKKVKNIFRNSKIKSERYGKNSAIWMKVAGVAPNVFAKAFTKRK